MKLPSQTRLSALASRWMPRATMGIVDQGLFSGSNFLVNILLARWLLPDAYGSFAIAFAIYLGLAGIVCSLTLEPMMVYATTDFSGNIRDYLSKISLIHFGISGGLGLILLISSMFFGGQTGIVVSIAACALPFMLQVWFVRRALYCTMQLTHAAIVSLLYSLTLIGGISVLKYIDMIQPLYIYEVFVLASLVCFMYYQIAVANRAEVSSTTKISVQQIADRHWTFGKWLVIASAAASISTLLYAPILGLMSELEDAAAYKAIQNLAMPFGQILTVFTMMMLPVMSRVVKSDSQNRINKYIWGLTLGFGFGAFVYGMVLVLFGKQILLFLYNSMFYADYCWLIPVFALVLVIRAINQSLATIIRAYENTKTILAAKISTAVVVLFVLMIFVPIMNMHGVLLAMILGVLTEFCIVVRFFLRRKQKDGNNEVLR